MQYKENTKIIIDKRKLDTLFRLGVDERLIVQLLRTGSFETTNDPLINDNLETLIDVKTFTNWGGDRKSKKAEKLIKKNQLENQDDNQDDNQLENQDDRQVVDKDKDIDKDIETDKEVVYKTKGNVFIEPTVKEISDYCKERHNGIDPEHFYYFYKARGWLVSGKKMKDWKAAVITWEKRQKQNGGTQNGGQLGKYAGIGRKFSNED